MAIQKVVNGVYMDLTEAELAQRDADMEAFDLDLGQIRSQRNGMLSSSDWTQIGDASLGDHTAEEWRIYRTALKAIPQTYSRVSEVVWPEDPPTAKITRKTVAGDAAFDAAIASDPDDAAAAQAAYDTAYAATD